MYNGALLEPRTFAHAETQPGGPGDEAAEVASLLARAGVDHASSLWFQLLELATQIACDWTERSAAAGAPLIPRDAAALGLRSLAMEILSALPSHADRAGAAAEACLHACTDEVAVKATSLPPRRRRWGEGASPQPPRRPGLLAGAAGCC